MFVVTCDAGKTRPKRAVSLPTPTVDFATVSLTKPSPARLMSVDDKIHLEIEHRTTRAAQ